MTLLDKVQLVLILIVMATAFGLHIFNYIKERQGKNENN